MKTIIEKKSERKKKAIRKIPETAHIPYDRT